MLRHEPGNRRGLFPGERQALETQTGLSLFLASDGTHGRLRLAMGALYGASPRIAAARAGMCADSRIVSSVNRVGQYGEGLGRFTAALSLPSDYAQYR